MYATPARPRDPEAEAARLTFLARYSPDTQKTYRVALDRFFTWCDEYGIRPLDAERAHLELFSHWLTEDQQLKNSTAYGYLSVISTYFRLAVADRRIDRDPTIMLRKPKVYYDDDRLGGLSRHDLEKLILHAAERSPERAALVILMGVMGLRVSEAIAVRIEDFAGFERGHRVLRIIGKGGKPATMPLPPLVFRALDRAAGDRTSGYLITTRSGRKPSRHDAFRWIGTLGRQAGLGHVHPHMLRHSALTGVLDAGATTRDAQTFGRWASSRMVERYDRNRHNLDRHASYLIASHLSGIAAKLDDSASVAA